MGENENAEEEVLGTGSKYKEEVEDLGKGGKRVGRGRRIWVNMRKCHGRELYGVRGRRI
jgi:hypothetical protein